MVDKTQTEGVTLSRGEPLGLFPDSAQHFFAFQTILALVIAVTRSQSQTVAGVFFTLTSLFLLAEMVVSLGAGTGLVYFTARSRSLGQSSRIRAFQRAALVPVLVL